MKITKIAFFALAAALAISPAAFATSVPFSVGATSGFGQSYSLTGERTGTTVITSTTGLFQFNGYSAGNYKVEPTGFVPSTLTINGHQDDTIFASGGTPFTTKGLVIYITSGEFANDLVWLYQDGSKGTDVQIFDFHGKRLVGENFAFAPTPEPSSMLLLGTGLLSLAGLVFWKSKSSNGVKAQTLAM